MANSLEFAGIEQFRAPEARVRAALADLGQILRLLPNVESVESQPDGSVRGVVRPGFSFLRGKLAVTLRRDGRSDVASPDAAAEVTAAAAPIKLLVNSKGIGVSIDLAAELTIADESQPGALPAIAVRWHVKVTQLSGLVAAVSKPLIGAAAEQIIRESWQRIHAAIDER